MLSIVIPTYNEEDNLPILLSSIINQTFDDYEIIIADNNSTDRTIEIARAFGATITKGGLPGAGRNRGAEAANREFILFLDADVILPDKYFLQSTIAEFGRKNYGVATCEIKALSNKKVDFLAHEAYNIWIKSTAGFLPYAPGFCIFARRDVHQAINGFNELIRLGEDSDYVTRASKISKFKILSNYKIPVSVRRLDRDGRLNVVLKYILCGIYIKTIGNVETDMFNYSFGHKQK